MSKFLHAAARAMTIPQRFLRKQLSQLKHTKRLNDTPPLLIVGIDQNSPMTSSKHMHAQKSERKKKSVKNACFLTETECKWTYHVWVHQCANILPSHYCVAG